MLTVLTKLAYAQNDLTINNGDFVPVTRFPTGCIYNWVNDKPNIGLPAAGSGDLPAFVAVNNGNLPVTATISATPISGDLAYISNGSSSNISIIDTRTNSIIGSIPASLSPANMLMSPDGTQLYVSDYYANTVTVINTATRSKTKTVILPQNGGGNMALNTGGTLLYIVNNLLNTVSVMNTANNTIVKNIAVGASPYDIVVSPDGSLVYVINTGDQTISVINTVAGIVKATIPLPSHSYPPRACLAISPDGSRLYANDSGGNSLYFIDTKTLNVTSFPAFTYNEEMKTSADGKILYAVGGGEGLEVIDATTGEQIANVSLGFSSGAQAFGLSSDGNFMYIANSFSNTVSVVDTRTYVVGTTVNVGGFPNSVAVFSTLSTCAPHTFTITVNWAPPAGIIANSTPAAVQTVYGTPSTASSFEVSVTGQTADVTVTPPPGFELSTNGSTFGPSVILSGNGISTIYIRLAAVTDVGNYTGIITFKSGNYEKDVTMPTSIVTPAPININANAITKSYGTTMINGPASANGYTISGALKNGDQITSVNLTYGSGAIATDNIGTYLKSVSIATITGNASFKISNYKITTIAGDLTVTPAPLTITLTDEVKLYGTTLVNGIKTTGFSVIGLQNQQNIEYLTINYGQGAMPTTTVGIYTGSITGSFPEGSVFTPNNYAPITYVYGTIMVNPASLIITVLDAVRDYGRPNPAFEASYSGFVNNDNALVFLNQPVFTTPANVTSPPGTYPLQASGVTAVNYTITYIDGTLTVRSTPSITLNIPNTFTPNGDGRNDQWQIGNISNYPNCTVIIYNRYGQSMYNSKGYNYAWDGQYRGKPVPSGTYYFVIDLKNNSKPLSGNVTVIR